MCQILTPRYLRNVLRVPDGINGWNDVNIKAFKIGEFSTVSSFSLDLSASVALYTDGGL